MFDVAMALTARILRSLLAEGSQLNAAIPDYRIVRL
jgi:hypothetical protein